MDPERWWGRFVAAVTVGWIGLFAVDVGVAVGVLALPEPRAAAVRTALRWLLVVFLLDLALLYRWSDQGPRAFLRAHWFLVLTVVPWFRPLRVLRAGRVARTVRLLAGSRRVASLATKLRRTGRRLWDRLRDRER